MKKIISLSLLSGLLIGCEPFIENHGYNQETLDAGKIQINVDTKETIQEKMGTPSSTSIFPIRKGNVETEWFYITKRTSSKAFFTPDTLNQQTLVIGFNEKGIAVDVQMHDGEKRIPLNPRKTESTAYESNVMRDIFGNFGKYTNKTPTPQK